MAEDVCLRQMHKDQSFIITRVTARGEVGRRIRDMGLTPGAEGRVMGRAPLKDPVAIRLKDFTLSLRNNEADHVFVQPLGE
jgi:ferrous iron transport protein A